MPRNVLYILACGKTDAERISRIATALTAFLASSETVMPALLERDCLNEWKLCFEGKVPASRYVYAWEFLAEEMWSYADPVFEISSMSPEERFKAAKEIHQLRRDFERDYSAAKLKYGC